MAAVSVVLELPARQEPAEQEPGAITITNMEDFSADNASGPIIYFAMRYSMADEVSAAAAQMAADRGLVCFDPQWDRLRPAPDER